MRCSNLSNLRIKIQAFTQHPLFIGFNEYFFNCASSIFPVPISYLQKQAVKTQFKSFLFNYVNSIKKNK